ncbi:uncharacterized protein B0T15DRAFT_539790 [Chaetomium strumarium]|uniref:Nuclear transport factor 2 n=1 Tax=Chaetomium strumarium TaxID=1170767 RepID=A0AAJ0LZC7_9PEZI|nr:hypothetical protein B0T15DRAFT_539790 [Chaetomium strumarium]
MDFQGIATQFVDHYYKTFDADRSGLASLYRENSMLTFQDSQHLGVSGIVEKLVNLPFQKVTHQPTTTDAQPTPNGGIMILVCGQLLVREHNNNLLV